MSELNEMNCAQLADVAAELALGVLTGREPAEAIAHLDQCHACREDVRQLMLTVEELLGLLPASEPPAGFETQVLERLGLPAPGRSIARPSRHRRHCRPARSRSGPVRRVLAAAAVTVAVAGASLGGWGIA